MVVSGADVVFSLVLALVLGLTVLLHDVSTSAFLAIALVGPFRPTCSRVSTRRAAQRLLQSVTQVVTDAKRVRHRGQSGVDRADAREDARVDDVEVVELVRAALGVHH